MFSHIQKYTKTDSQYVTNRCKNGEDLMQD